MVEERLDRIESMLSQSIKMVGNLQVEQQAMKQEISEFKKDQQAMKQEMTDFNLDQQIMRQDITALNQNQGILADKQTRIEARSEECHHEVIERLNSVEIDQDFIWRK